MVILGISEGPDAAAALVVDGQLVAAVQQERVDRVRHSAAFPSGAIDAVLERAGLRAREVDRVVVGGAPPPLDALGERLSSPSSASLTRKARLGNVARDWVRHLPARPRMREAVTAGLRASGLHMVALDIERRRAAPILRTMGFENATIDVVEEDRCQAWAAYRTQPDDDLLILLLDSAIDGAAVSVSVAQHGQVDRLLLQTSFAPLSGLPSRLAARVRVDEGQLVTIGCVVAPDPALVAAIGAVIGFDGGAFRTGRPHRGADALERLAEGVDPHRYVSSALAAMDVAVVAFARHWMARTRVSRLALAGTLLANPRLVAQVLTEAAPSSLWVVPAPGAGAAAIGAALGAAGTPPAALPTLTLGPRYTDDQCYRALSVAELPRNKVVDPEAVAAAAITDGKIVARFAGGLSFGRAPGGGRSVLFRADDPALRARARTALGGRPELPPGVLLPAAKLGELVPNLAHATAARTCSVSGVPAPAVAVACSAALNSDATVLPTAITEEDPALLRLLAAVESRLGLPIVAEISLNRAGEPIACSPGDAIRAWRGSGIDLLILGPYMVEA